MAANNVSKFERPTLADLNKVLELNPDKVLAVQDDNGLQVGSFTFTPTGLVVRPSATYNEWKEVGGILHRLDGSLQWLIGDWLVHGQRAWGETYEQIAAATGYEVKTLYNYSYVAAHVDFSSREENLTFGHHNLVAGMEPGEQIRWLAEAIERDWSVAELRDAIHPKSLPADPVERQFHTLVKGYSGLGQGDRARYIELVRRWLDGLDAGDGE